MKLRLNLPVKDLSYRFGISTVLISEYVTTWVCFMYHQLKEIDHTQTGGRNTSTWIQGKVPKNICDNQC